MSLLRGRSAFAYLLLSLASFVAEVPAQDASPEAPARPVRDSIEPIVARIDRERSDPCEKATEAKVPCYPTSVEAHGPVFSVRDSLEVGSEKTGGFRIPFDRVVCATKSAINGLKGKNDVYFLYRVRLLAGEHVELRQWRLDPGAVQGKVEFLGRFNGECDALAAYRREDRLSSPTASVIEVAGRPTR
jgi:hypothetical protein